MTPPEAPDAVGFVGLGTMGLPMASCLVNRGFRVIGHDLDAQNSALAASAGVTIAQSPAEVGERCGIVITMLPTSAIVREALIGADPVLGVGCVTDVVLDMSSSVPADTIELERLLRERGVKLLDAPVSGRRENAESGRLTVMVGGDSSVIDGVAAVLDALAATVVHTGSVGSGHAAKALNNLLSANGLLAAAEIMAAGVKFGIEPEILLEVINASSGANHATLHKYTPQILSGAFDSGFALALMAKDVEIAQGLMADIGSPHRISSVVADLTREALAAEDSGSDHTAAVRIIERSANVSFRSAEVSSQIDSPQERPQ